MSYNINEMPIKLIINPIHCLFFTVIIFKGFNFSYRKGNIIIDRLIAYESKIKTTITNVNAKIENLMNQSPAIILNI